MANTGTCVSQMVMHRVYFTMSPESETLLHCTTVDQREDTGYLANIAYCHICTGQRVQKLS